METVKLVIEIPESLYTSLKERPATHAENLALYEYITDGTPLPKGHGRLIDVDALDVGQVVDGSGYRCGYKYITKHELDKAPTIIEADESEDE